MKRGRIFEIIGLLGALASIIVAIDSYIFKSPLVEWLLTPTGIPTWLLVSLFAVMSMLLVVSGRLLVARARVDIIPADAHSIMNYVIENKIFERTSRMDFYHYTAETLLTPWRDILEKHTRELKIRLLVRRPETDPGKHQVAEGSLDTTLEICKQNPNIDIDVRFYQHEPLLRLQFYFESNSATCITGVYRYDHQHPMKYIGAEENEMFVLKENRLQEKTIIRALHSRFENQWNQSSCLRAVIFDMDGVLVNTMSYHYQSWRESFRTNQINVDEEEFRKDVYRLEGLDADETVRTLYSKYKRTFPSEDIIKKVVDEKVKLYIQLSSKAEPFEGVSEVLDYLNSRGVPLCLVTGSNRGATEKIVQRLFPTRFQVIVTGNDVEKGKPDPMPFRKALEHLKIGNQKQCLVVENAPLGVQAAVGAGIPVYGILMDSPLDPKQLEEVGADRVFADHQDLLKEISELHFRSISKLPNKALHRTRMSARR